jgi:hypothetical protein
MQERVRARQYLVTLHATEEMDDDDLSIVDVETCIQANQIVARYRDHVTVGYRYLVEGQTIAGDPIVVVGKLSAGGTLVIVTVYRIEKAGRKV